MVNVNSNQGVQLIDRPNVDLKVDRFKQLMLYKLKKNAHKGGWKNMSLQELYNRLDDEMMELLQSLEIFVQDTVKNNPMKVAFECADVANFCMMIADVVTNETFGMEMK